ncbi:MAG: hypothetical protein WBP85_05410 [Terracidiphilus sp.]
MRGLAGEQLLRAWECSREMPEQQAALALLEFAEPERPAREWARLPLARRDALLLELRAATLGRRMEGFALCPACGAQLEFAVDARELAKGLTEPPAPAKKSEGIAMRPANTLDLLASAAAASEEDARAILLARSACATSGKAEAVTSAEKAQRWLKAQPRRAAAQLAKRFEQLNAAAEIRFELQCAACGKGSVLDFDLVHYLLREMGAAARRLMAEIHELARAYGWSEAAIAGMSAARRTAYLEMLGT